MKYLQLWRRASSILQWDLPRLALAGRSYQQTRQAHALYMLRDKIRRRGFSDKTVKDYLSFGGLVVICYQNGFCGGERNDSNGKMMEKRKRRRGGGGDWRRQKGMGGESCSEDFVFCWISCPFPLPFWHHHPSDPLHHPSNEPSVSHILNLTGKHSRVIGAASQSNVLFATGERLKDRGKGGGGYITSYSYSSLTLQITNFKDTKTDAQVTRTPRTWFFGITAALTFSGKANIKTLGANFLRARGEGVCFFFLCASQDF